MPDPAGTSRRAFLRAAAATGAIGSVGCAWPFDTGHAAAAAALARLVDPSDDVRRLGTEYLSRHPGEDVDALADQLVSGLGYSPPLVDEQLLARLLRESITADFVHDETVSFGGWLLSRTEVQLFALVEATMRTGDDRGIDGMFPPETAEASNARFRWTTGAAAFSVPGNRDVLALPVRSMTSFEQRLTIGINGQVVDELALPDTAWHQFTYLLPCRGERHRRSHLSDGSRPGATGCDAASLPVRVDLRVAPTWQPLNDFRTLGIQLGETPWTT